MIERYTDIIDHVDRNDQQLADFIPSASESLKIKEPKDHLSKFQSVSQSKSSIWFNDNGVCPSSIWWTVERLSTTWDYLGLNGIAHSSRFGESLAKASEGAQVTTAEKGCLHMFAQDVVQTVSASGEASYAEMVLARKRQRQEENGLTNVNWVCPTSNRLERQFSEVKHMFPQSRKSALPKNRGSSFSKDQWLILGHEGGRRNHLVHG